MTNSSTTKISYKPNKNERFMPRGNMRSRPTEAGYDKYLGEMHQVQSIEKLGASEVKLYMAICDMDAQIARECSLGKCHLYGTARWHEIARRLNVLFEVVYGYIGN